MSPPVSEATVLTLLGAIEAGRVDVKLVDDAKLAGDGVMYETSNGWRIRICSDFGGWSQLCDLWAPDGTHIDPWECFWTSECGGVRFYDPPPDLARAVYRVTSSAA